MTPALTPALGHLREATAALHREAERHVRILDPDATDATYVRYLARMYGVHAAIEDAFAASGPLADAGFDATARRKRDWLARDLAHFGVVASQLPRCQALPALPDLAAAVGAAYVIEGSTLGGAFIVARMRPRLGHLLAVASAFLTGHGAATGPMWRAFVALAERALDDEPRRAAAAAAARATFTTLIAWLDEPAVDPPHPHRGLERRRRREAEA